MGESTFLYLSFSFSGYAQSQSHLSTHVRLRLQKLTQSATERKVCSFPMTDQGGNKGGNDFPADMVFPNQRSADGKCREFSRTLVNVYCIPLKSQTVILCTVHLANISWVNLSRALNEIYSGLVRCIEGQSIYIALIYSYIYSFNY